MRHATLPPTLEIRTPAARSAALEPPGGRDPVLSTAIEVALVDLSRALCQDRANAVVAATREEGRALLRALAEHLSGALRVVAVSGGSLREGELSGRILRGLGRESGLDPDGSLRRLLEEHAARGPGVALLVEDAGALDEATLFRLGRLAAATRPGLRLALVVTQGPAGQADPIPALVSALGIGAERIVLDVPGRRVPAEPRVPGPPPAEPRPLPPLSPLPAGPSLGQLLGGIRAALPGRLPRPPAPPANAVQAGLIAGLALLLTLGVRAVAPLEPEAAPVAAPAPVAAARPAAGIEAPPIVEALALEAPALPEAPVVVEEPTAAVEEPPAAASREAPEPPPAAPPAEAPVALAPAPDVPEPAPPAPAPPDRRIRVGLNARPWARIAVDGRDVGVTPLGDLRLAPGPHVFRAEFPDGRVVERSVRIDALVDRVTFP